MSGNIKSHKDLLVWKKSMDLVTRVYTITKDFPCDEVSGLTSQIRRSVVSVPSNIAEGSARQTRKEFIQYLYIASGSISELGTQMLIAANLNFIENDEIILKEIDEIGKMLSGLIFSLKKNG